MKLLLEIVVNGSQHVACQKQRPMFPGPELQGILLSMLNNFGKESNIRRKFFSENHSAESVEFLIVVCVSVSVDGCVDLCGCELLCIGFL